MYLMQKVPQKIMVMYFRNKFLAMTLIRPYFDKEFSLKEFSQGAKEGMIMHINIQFLAKQTNFFVIFLFSRIERFPIKFLFHWLIEGPKELIFFIFFLWKNVFNKIPTIHMIFQYGPKPVLIQRTLSGLQSILKNKFPMKIYFSKQSFKLFHP